MGQGYTRNDTANNIADGNVIDAVDLDGEFDAIVAAFESATGHAHDGTSAEGAPIEVTGPAQEYVSDGTALYPKTDNTYDLGKAASLWKILYGTTALVTNIRVSNLKANDGTAAGSIADSTGVVTLASAVLTTADINGGTLDAVTIGATTPAAADFTTVDTTGAVTIGGTASVNNKFTAKANIDVGDTGTSTEARTVAVGIGRTGDGTSKLDLVGDTTNSTYGLRVARFGGVNGASSILHEGTGTLSIKTEGAGDLVFSTSDTTAVTIDATSQEVTVSNDLTASNLHSSGDLRASTTLSASGLANTTTEEGLVYVDASMLVVSRSSGLAATFNRLGTTGSAVAFRSAGVQVGTIGVTGSATSYNTSSDERLKYEEGAVQGASDIVMRMRPMTYRFKSDDSWSDGFFAHELQEVLPYAVSGERGAEDEEGNPEYQSVDYSKLTPILTAALKEALSKIEGLERRVAAMEAK